MAKSGASVGADLDGVFYTRKEFDGLVVSEARKFSCKEEGVIETTGANMRAGGRKGNDSDFAIKGRQGLVENLG